MYFAVLILQKTSSLHGQILGTVFKKSVIDLSNLHCTESQHGWGWKGL